MHSYILISIGPIRQKCIYLDLMTISRFAGAFKPEHNDYECNTKKRIRFENTPRRIPEFLLWQVHLQGSQKSMKQPNQYFPTSRP